MKNIKKNKDFNLAKIKIIGVGGAGGNAVTRMYEELPRGVDSIVINTDIQDLNYCFAKKKIYIGKNITKGLGAGMNPNLGHQAAEENQTEIAEALKGADMVFLTAGFGGGTGTGALPVIADIAKDLGILTVAVITKPFTFEGYERQRIAEDGIIKVKNRVDTLITIPNEKIFAMINKNTSLVKAFEAIDEVLKSSVIGITDLIAMPGIVNVDFADVKAILQNAGSAIIGIGVSSGVERASNAANLVINSPLLEISANGAKRVLFSISGHRDLKMGEINEVARIISENVNHSAKIIFGAFNDRKLKKGNLKVTLVAADFNGEIRKDAGSLPNLFVSDYPIKNTSEIFINKNNLKEKEAQKNDDDKASNENGKGKDNSGNDNNIWDIPTFLRKKR